MSTTALVQFLRCEADLADERAKRLRAQAEAMAIEFGVSGEMQQAYEMDPDEMAPLDENGIPKYKGRKRGRKAKKRKRPKNPDRPKRQHTAYTLFVQENYPSVRALNPTLQSKDVITIVARQWAAVTDLEKQAWKQRAHETALAEAPQEAQAALDGVDVVAVGVSAGVVDPEEEEEDIEEEEEEIEEDEEVVEVEEPKPEEESPPKKRGRGRPRRK